jgi:hypothetical protein
MKKNPPLPAETLDIIFTTENGQLRTNLPLEQVVLFRALDNKLVFEAFLQLIYQSVATKQVLGDTNIIEIAEQTGEIMLPALPKIEKLFKISTCITTKSPKPEWWSNFDGKFYY